MIIHLWLEEALVAIYLPFTPPLLIIDVAEFVQVYKGCQEALK